MATATAMAARTVNVVSDIRTNCFLLTLQKIRELLRLKQRSKIGFKNVDCNKRSHSLIIII